MLSDLLVFYDNEIDGHFPPHFKEVYLSLLPERYGLVTAMVAMTSKKYANMPEGVLLLWNKKSPSSFVLRVFYSLHHIVRILGFCLFHKDFKNAKNILIHNDPILCILVNLLSSSNVNVIFRITHLKYEEVINSGNKSQFIMGKLAIYLRSLAIYYSDKIIVMSSSMKQFFLENEKSLAEEKVKVVESMIDTSIGFDGESLDSKITEFVNQGFTMVYVGTLALSRDLQHILDVTSDLIQRHDSVRLLILGQGDSTSLNESVNDMNISSHVLVVEALPEKKMLKAISMCDLGISHYPYDQNTAFLHNSPVKLLNYIQAGVSVVGTDIPDQIEVLLHAGKGILVKNSKQEYVQAIDRIITVPGEFVPDMEADMQWLLSNRSIDVASQRIFNICHDNI